MCPFNGVSVRIKKGSRIGRRSYKYKTFDERDLPSRRHQFAGSVIDQVVNLLIVHEQRTINRINLTVITSGRNNIRTQHANFRLGQV
jgi:hypothetical protein